MEPFLNFTSSWSSLEPDEYVNCIMNLWKALSDTAKDFREQSLFDPENQRLARAAMNAARNLLAFGDMIRAANILTTKRIEDMRREALENPNGENSQKIIELADNLIEMYANEKKNPSGKPN